MSILLGEEDNTPNWDKEIERLVERSENSEELKTDNTEPAAENPILELNYNITIDEEDKAFRLFQRLYVYKKNIINTVLFGVVAVIFLFQIIADRTSYLSWGLMVICLAMIFLTWITPIRVRKMLLVALEALKDDRYVFRLFKKEFEIETIIPKDDEALAKELVEEDRESGDFDENRSDYKENEDEEIDDYDGRIKPEKSVYKYPSEDMRIVETDEMFLIFISKQTFHVIPKRCVSQTDSDILKRHFIKKFDNYLNATSKAKK